MMNDLDFDLAKHFGTAVDRIDAREVDEILAPDLRESIFAQPRAALYARVQDDLCDFRLDRIPAALADYRLALRERMTFERTRGSLKPPSTPIDEVKRVAETGYFEKYLVNGFELRTLADWLEPGERIDIHAPAFRLIKTDRREIVRGGDFFDQGRPVGYTKEFWLKKCTPAHLLAEAEEKLKREEREAARPFSDFAGPNVRPR